MSSPPVQLTAVDPDGETVDLGEESDDYDDDFGDDEEEEEEVVRYQGEEDEEGYEEEDDDDEDEEEEGAGSGGLTALLLGNENNGDEEEEDEQDHEYAGAPTVSAPVQTKGTKRALSEPEADGGGASPSQNGEGIIGTAKKAKVL